MALVPYQRPPPPARSTKPVPIPTEMTITYEMRWDQTWHELDMPSALEWTTWDDTPYGVLRTPLTEEEWRLHQQNSVDDLHGLLANCNDRNNPAATEEDKRQARAQSEPIRNVLVGKLSGRLPVLATTQWNGWMEEGPTRRYRARIELPSEALTDS